MDRTIKSYLISILVGAPILLSALTLGIAVVNPENHSLPKIAQDAGAEIRTFFKITQPKP